MNTTDRDVWVFLSHSNKDYDKVRQVRNALEDYSLRPLMFFLQCLDDEEEIDSLIKREIDCRTRFLLCDSENARHSKWVQKEVEYIKSQNRICETVNLDRPMAEILSGMKDFLHRANLFISYNKELYPLAKEVYNRLGLYDFNLYIDRYWDSEEEYTQDYGDTLDFLGKASREGYIIALINHSILNFDSGSRFELLSAIDNNERDGKDVPSIIPFVTDDALAHSISLDEDLVPLSRCGIHSLEGIPSEKRCDEIIRIVLRRLMTSGSIKVQADNFAKGNELMRKEADFLKIIDWDLT